MSFVGPRDLSYLPEGGHFRGGQFGERSEEVLWQSRYKGLKKYAILEYVFFSGQIPLYSYPYRF